MTINLTNSTLLKTQAYIDGQWIEGDNNDTFDVLNPATGEVLAQWSVSVWMKPEERLKSPIERCPYGDKNRQRTRPIITSLV